MKMNLLNICKSAQKAAYEISTLSNTKRNKILKDISIAIKKNSEQILKANNLDQNNNKSLSKELKERLILNESKLDGIRSQILDICKLPDPLLTKESFIRKDGLKVSKKIIPVGVIASIYESRPNVTVDISCLAIKSGNVAILRGGKEAINTNLIFAKLIKNCLYMNGASKNAIQLITDTDRKYIDEMLAMDEFIDLVIPRGGKKLVKMVSEKAKMRAIFGGIGVCHLYIDEKVDESIIIPIIENSKVQAPSVCNSLDTILIHEKHTRSIFPKIIKHLISIGVETRLDNNLFLVSKRIINSKLIKRATKEDWGQEFLGLTISIKSVKSIEKAIDHISINSFNHTDSILSKSKKSQNFFIDKVNSSAVMVNSSTRFNDGGQLGLGAEIAISTTKLSPRGPLGLNEITSYKWVVVGEGHIRA